MFIGKCACACLFVLSVCLMVICVLVLCAFVCCALLCICSTCLHVRVCLGKCVWQIPSFLDGTIMLLCVRRRSQVSRSEARWSRGCAVSLDTGSSLTYINKDWHVLLAHPPACHPQPRSWQAKSPSPCPTSLAFPLRYNAISSHFCRPMTAERTGISLEGRSQRGKKNKA